MPTKKSAPAPIALALTIPDALALVDALRLASHITHALALHGFITPTDPHTDRVIEVALSAAATIESAALALQVNPTAPPSAPPRTLAQSAPGASGTTAHSSPRARRAPAKNAGTRRAPGASESHD